MKWIPTITSFCIDICSFGNQKVCFIWAIYTNWKCIELIIWQIYNSNCWKLPNIAANRSGVFSNWSSVWTSALLSINSFVTFSCPDKFDENIDEKMMMHDNCPLCNAQRQCRYFMFLWLINNDMELLNSKKLMAFQMKRRDEISPSR